MGSSPQLKEARWLGMQLEDAIRPKKKILLIKIYEILPPSKLFKDEFIVCFFRYVVFLKRFN